MSGIDNFHRSAVAQNSMNPGTPPLHTPPIINPIRQIYNENCFRLCIRYYKVISIYMNRKHRKTLASIFAEPVRANVAWRDIEGLFAALGADMSEGRGSRVRVSLHEVDAVFHRPHPQTDTDKGALKSVRRFLNEAGIAP